MKEKNIKLYNVLFPIWLIIWFPSFLWLFLIPLNYLVDMFVLRWGLEGRPDKKELCNRLGWRVCLAGFLSDFIGSALLLGFMLLDIDDRAFIQIQSAVGMDPFRYSGAVAVTVAAIAISAVCIFLLDRRILRRAGLEDGIAKSAALKLAIVTAPYLFLIPSRLLYNSPF